MAPAYNPFKPASYAYEPQTTIRARQASAVQAMAERISPLVAAGDPVSIQTARQIVRDSRAPSPVVQQAQAARRQATGEAFRSIANPPEAGAAGADRPSFLGNVANAFRSLVPREVRDGLATGFGAATSASAFADLILPGDPGTAVKNAIERVPVIGTPLAVGLDAGLSPLSLASAGLGSTAAGGAALARLGSAGLAGRLAAGAIAPAVQGGIASNVAAQGVMGVGGYYGARAAGAATEALGGGETAQAVAGLAGGLAGGVAGLHGINAARGGWRATARQQAQEAMRAAAPEAFEQGRTAGQDLINPHYSTGGRAFPVPRAEDLGNVASVDNYLAARIPADELAGLREFERRQLAGELYQAERTAKEARRALERPTVSRETAPAMAGGAPLADLERATAEYVSDSLPKHVAGFIRPDGTLVALPRNVEHDAFAKQILGSDATMNDLMDQGWVTVRQGLYGPNNLVVRVGRQSPTPRQIRALESAAGASSPDVQLDYYLYGPTPGGPGASAQRSSLERFRRDLADVYAGREQSQVAQFHLAGGADQPRQPFMRGGQAAEVKRLQAQAQLEVAESGAVSEETKQQLMEAFGRSIGATTPEQQAAAREALYNGPVPTDMREVDTGLIEGFRAKLGAPTTGTVENALGAARQAELSPEEAARQARAAARDAKFERFRAGLRRMNEPSTGAALSKDPAKLAAAARELNSTLDDDLDTLMARFDTQGPTLDNRNRAVQLFRRVTGGAEEADAQIRAVNSSSDLRAQFDRFRAQYGAAPEPPEWAVKGERPTNVEELRARAESGAEPPDLEVEQMRRYSESLPQTYEIPDPDPFTPDQQAKLAAAQAEMKRPVSPAPRTRADARQVFEDTIYHPAPPAPGQKPRADLVLGVSGAGKSRTFVDPITEQYGSLVIDADDVKKLIPEFNNGNGASAVHEESSQIVGRIFTRAIANGDNFVYPMVGKSRGKVQAIVEELANAGYDVHLRYMDLPAEEGARRAWARYLQGNQGFVDPAYVRAQGTMPRETYDALKTHPGVTDYAAYSNDVPRGTAPRFLEEGTGRGDAGLRAGGDQAGLAAAPDPAARGAAPPAAGGPAAGVDDPFAPFDQPGEARPTPISKERIARLREEAMRRFQAGREAPPPSAGGGAPDQRPEPFMREEPQGQQPRTVDPEAVAASQTIAPGDAGRVSLEQIRTRPELFQARDTTPGASFDERKVQNLVENWSPDRVDPLVVAPDPEGGYVVLSGHHRLEAARRVGAEDLPVRVVNADLTTNAGMNRAQTEAILGNFGQAEQNVRERVRAFSTLADHGMSVDEIGAQARMSAEKVQRTLDVGHAGAAIVDRVTANPQLEGVAAEVGRFRRMFGVSEEDAQGTFDALVRRGKGETLPSAPAVRRMLDRMAPAFENRQLPGFEGNGFGGDSTPLYQAVREGAKLQDELLSAQRRINREIASVKSLGERAGVDVSQLEAAGQTELSSINQRLGSLESEVMSRVRTQAEAAPRTTGQATLGEIAPQASRSGLTRWRNGAPGGSGTPNMQTPLVALDDSGRQSWGLYAGTPVHSGEDGARLLQFMREAERQPRYYAAVQSFLRDEIGLGDTVTVYRGGTGAPSGPWRNGTLDPEVAARFGDVTSDQVPTSSIRALGDTGEAEVIYQRFGSEPPLQGGPDLFAAAGMEPPPAGPARRTLELPESDGYVRQPEIPGLEPRRVTARDDLGAPPTASDYGRQPGLFAPEPPERGVARVAGLFQQLREDPQRTVLDLLNAPRSLMASGDLSYSLRQNAMLAPNHPKAWLQSMKDQLGAWRSVEGAQAVADRIVGHPLYPYLKKMGVEILEQGGHQDEAYLSKIVEGLPLQARSARAATAAGNSMRAGVAYDWLTSFTPEQLARMPQGRLEAMGAFINAATGRGQLPEVLQTHAQALNALFFAPRNFIGKVQANLAVFSRDAEVRKEAAKSLAAFYGTGIGILGLAKLAGANVGVEPTSSDFGKITLPGGTRIDIWGGNQQLFRFVANLVTGEATSARTGQSYDQARGETVYRFLKSKLAPVPAAVVAGAQGESPSGEQLRFSPPAVGEQALRMVTPLFIQELVDATRGAGPVEGIVAGVGSAVGLGTQAYEQGAGDQLARQTFGKQYGELSAQQRNELAAAHPDLQGKILEEQAQAGGRGGQAAAFRQQAYQQQLASDQQLLEGKLTRQDWQQQRGDRTVRLRGQLEAVYGPGQAITDAQAAKDPLKRYLKAIADSTDPSTGAVDQGALERARAGWDQATNEAIDKSLGTSDTPLVRAYRRAANVYYELPRYQGYTSDEARAIDELWSRARANAASTDDLAMSRALRQVLAQAGDVDPRIVTGVRRRIAGSLPTAPDRKRATRRDPLTAYFFGTPTPQQRAQAEQQLQQMRSEAA